MDASKQLSLTADENARKDKQAQRAPALAQALRDEQAAREAAEQEADRWRHGQTIEGDFVCPDSLRALAAEQENERLRQTIETLLPWLDEMGRKHAMQGDEEPVIEGLRRALNGDPQ